MIFEQTDYTLDDKQYSSNVRIVVLVFNAADKNGKLFVTKPSTTECTSTRLGHLHSVA